MLASRISITPPSCRWQLQRAAWCRLDGFALEQDHADSVEGVAKMLHRWFWQSTAECKVKILQ